MDSPKRQSVGGALAAIAAFLSTYSGLKTAIGGLLGVEMVGMPLYIYNAIIVIVIFVGLFFAISPWRYHIASLWQPKNKRGQITWESAINIVRASMTQASQLSYDALHDKLCMLVVQHKIDVLGIEEKEAEFTMFPGRSEFEIETWEPISLEFFRACTPITETDNGEGFGLQYIDVTGKYHRPDGVAERYWEPRLGAIDLRRAIRKHKKLFEN